MEVRRFREMKREAIHPAVLLVGFACALAASTATAGPPGAPSLPRLPGAFPALVSPGELAGFLRLSAYLDLKNACPPPGPDRMRCAFPVLADLDDVPVSPESEFLDRGYRNPWMSALASLVLPGAGQFYNSATAYAFTLQGYRIWMYAQGGLQAGLAVAAVLQQFVGMRVVFAGDAAEYAITEKDAQVWRIVYLLNAVVASATAWFEANMINRAGKRYVMTMRAGAHCDPRNRALGVEVVLRF